MSDTQGGSLTPVTPARVAEELVKISALRRDGALEADEYEHRFARMIGEIRDRRVSGTRAEILAALTPLVTSGKVSQADLDRLVKQLGLV